MIVGHGDIASVLLDRPDLLFFASGVSNSQEKREDEYQRERLLFFKQDKTKHIVYFSSLAVFYSDTEYTRHKLDMEDLVKYRFPKYTIIRLGNITWGTNPNTIINYIRAKIKKNEPFTVKDEYRYIIDKDEFLHWIELIPDWSCEMNITGQRLKVKDIITKYGYLDLHTK